MVDSGIPNYGNICHSMFLSGQILNCSPSNADHSSSKRVLWAFFHQCVTPSLLQNVKCLLSKFYSGFRSSAHGPEHEPSLLSQGPPSSRHLLPQAASRPLVLPSGCSTRMKDAKLKTCCLFLPEPKHSAEFATHTSQNLIRYLTCPSSAYFSFHTIS